jgi:hypothetical protein
MEKSVTKSDDDPGNFSVVWPVKAGPQRTSRLKTTFSITLSSRRSVDMVALSASAFPSLLKTVKMGDSLRSDHPVTRTPLAGLVITPGVGELGVRGGVLDLPFPSSILAKRPVRPYSPNFCAAISCISSREMVPYMSMVVW